VWLTGFRSPLAFQLEQSKFGILSLNHWVTLEQTGNERPVVEPMNATDERLVLNMPKGTMFAVE